MSRISPEAILEVKRQSGATLSACKSALQSSDGDIQKALVLLRASLDKELLSLLQATELSIEQCVDLLNEWGSSSKALSYLKGQLKKDEPQSTYPEPPNFPIKPFYEIWEIHNPAEFVFELSQYLTDKKVFRKSVLSNTEIAFYLLGTMQASLEAEGFADLFYQEYSLGDCKLVENGLREIGLHRLANLFLEAKSIYVRHDPTITQETYETLDPFNLPNQEGQRLDQIADEFYENGSELFQIPQRLAIYARRKQNDFSP